MSISTFSITQLCKKKPCLTSREKFPEMSQPFATHVMTKGHVVVMDLFKAPACMGLYSHLLINLCVACIIMVRFTFPSRANPLLFQ